jgi:hypothetical protein
MREELTRRQEAAITALLQHGVVSRAAIASHVPESTLWRWMQQKDFAAAYRVARRTITERSVGLLQQASMMAAATLVNILQDANTPASVRMTAATRVLEFAFRGEELLDLEERIAALEETLESRASKERLRAIN